MSKDKWASENAWKTKFNNAPGRLWKYLEARLILSKNHLKRISKGKFYPTPYQVNFKDWYKEQNNV